MFQVETIWKAQLSLGRLYFWGINTTHQSGAKFNKTIWLEAKDPNGAKPFMGHRPLSMAVGFFNCLYLTQILTDLGQILNSISYDQA